MHVLSARWIARAGKGKAHRRTKPRHAALAWIHSSQPDLAASLTKSPLPFSVWDSHTQTAKEPVEDGQRLQKTLTMAEVDLAPSFGAELLDGFKPVNAWVANGIAWLDDIQQFYRERSAIEKEYSQKLSALAKKYHDRKAKKSSSLSVGETPTVTPGSLESASMTTWTVQLTTLEGRAAEHDRFSNQIISTLAEPLKHLAAKYDDLRKSHAEYAAKLEKERDAGYADLKKSKAKYDSVCQDVESRRKKTESSFDHGKQKAQAAFQQQQSDMRNAKNTYLITINVTNKQKERYYHDYVPELLDVRNISRYPHERLTDRLTYSLSKDCPSLERPL